MALLGQATHAGDRCIRAPTQTPNTEPSAGSLHMAGTPPQSLTESWLPILSELGQLWVVRVSPGGTLVQRLRDRLLLEGLHPTLQRTEAAHRLFTV